MKNWLNRHIDYLAAVICWSVGWIGCAFWTILGFPYYWVPWALSFIIVMLIMRWIEIRIYAVRRDGYTAGYEAGRAGEKARQIEQVEQAFEIKDEGAMVE